MRLRGLQWLICPSNRSFAKAREETFNNAAQVWNHSFYWNSISATGGGEPTGDLADAVKRDFGSVADFKTAFSDAAKGQFGSGWAWLVLTDGALTITTTSNANTPITTHAVPLLTLDVWEHAYYLDYQNKRDAYIEAYLGHLVNWDFAQENIKK